MNDIEWISNTEPCEHVALDVGFLISESYFFGDDNNFTKEQWQTEREPLYQPAIERYGSFVLASAVDADVPELGKYYKDVIRLAENYNKQIEDRSPYFWMRPLIYVQDRFTIVFPWYDTFPEAECFLNSVSSTTEGEVFWDCDQCWELFLYAADGQLFIREWDPDNEKDYVAINCCYADIQSQVAPTLKRTKHIIETLSADIGHNYWGGSAT